MAAGASTFVRMGLAGALRGRHDMRNHWRSRIAGAVVALALVSGGSLQAQGNLQYFGYTGVRSEADLTQTYSYTNITAFHALCTGSTDCGNCGANQSVVNDLNATSAKNVKVVLGLSDVLFCRDTATNRWQLRPDYITSWNSFRTANSSVLDSAHVASFYIMDEPTWNGVTFSELNSATNLVKGSYPTIPTSIVEAFPAVSNLIIPSAMDWIGFDQYGVSDPATSNSYQATLSTLKSKMTASQKVIYVMDAFHEPVGIQVGWTPSQLGCVASRWYSQALNDPSAVLLAAFFWEPSGGGLTGSVDLPQSVRDVHAAIGGSVTGKFLVQTAFTRQTPASTQAVAPTESGTRFSSSRAGTIQSIRFYKAAGETGTHIGRIWDEATGTQLASVIFTNETASGWQTQALATPLSIVANKNYRVSFNVNTQRARTQSAFLSPISNGTLTAINGSFTTPGGGYPSTLSNDNYFADVVFHPNSLPSYNCAPSYQGYHDYGSCSVTGGWARDGNPLNPPVSVDIYKDGVLQVAQLPANRFRQDLLNAGIGNGYNGFEYSIPAAWKDGQPHAIQVKIANTQTAIGWTPRWITCGGSHAPYSGTPASIPGTIQAENFDTGGEGNGYHDVQAANLGGVYRMEGVDIAGCSDGAGCYTVGWVQAGEWLLYTVNVPLPGTYTMQIRVASIGPGGTFHVEFNGVNKTGNLTVPNTGGWDNWQTITRTVTLDAGWQTMKLVMDTVGTTNYTGNFNYISF